MIALSIKLPEDLARRSGNLAKRLGITRSELIRLALLHEIEQAEARLERRAMAESLAAMGADASERAESEALDRALDEPLPSEEENWWQG
jgi:metal-responsive CopG/Arc/MetJ family transcriptional regulator